MESPKTWYLSETRKATSCFTCSAFHEASGKCLIYLLTTCLDLPFIWNCRKAEGFYVNPKSRNLAYQENPAKKRSYHQSSQQKGIYLYNILNYISTWQEIKVWIFCNRSYTHLMLSTHFWRFDLSDLVWPIQGIFRIEMWQSTFVIQVCLQSWVVDMLFLLVLIWQAPMILDFLNKQ